MKKLNAYSALSLFMTGINRELRKLCLRWLSKPPSGNVKLKQPCPDSGDFQKLFKRLRSLLRNFKTKPAITQQPVRSDELVWDRSERVQSRRLHLGSQGICDAKPGVGSSKCQPRLEIPTDVVAQALPDPCYSRPRLQWLRGFSGL